MDFTTLLLLAVLYGILSLIRQAGKRRPDTPTREDLEDEGGPALEPPATRSGRLPPGSTLPSASAGATRLEEFLREFERRVAEAGGLSARQGPMGRRSSEPLTGAEEVEERDSLEIEPEVTSLEVEPTGRGRQVVDLDEASAVTAAQRRRLAEQEDRTLTVAGHQAFDRRIRTAPSDEAIQEHAGAVRMGRLRQAMILNEVLGKPKGLRD